MKKLFLTLFLASMFGVSAAQAQSTGPLLFGGKAGLAKPHGSRNDEGFNVAGVLTQKFQANLYWEAELSLNLIDGEVGTNRDWSINSVAGYAVYRSDGNVHVKAKLGVSYWDDDFDDDTNLTAGIGLGIPAGQGVIDIEYTQINPNTDYITVGYVHRF